MKQVMLRWEREARPLASGTRESEGHAGVLERLLESMSDGLVLLDFRGRVGHLSPSLQDGQGEGASSGLAEDVLRRLRAQAARLRPGESARFDLPWERPALGIRQYRVTAAAGEKEEVGPAGAGELDERSITLFAFHDRTREAALEVELAQAERLASLGQMAATVAHELRNPLGAIQGFATLLRRDLEEDPEALRRIDRILQGVAGADRIVSDLLEYCRPLNPALAPCALNGLVEEAADCVRQAGRWNEAVKLQVSMEPGIPGCLADRRLLRQALINILQNALEATTGPGRIHVSIRPDGVTGRVRLVIRDTGCGLTAEEVSRVFAPFYTTKPGGTGLGLALVRKIISALHGHAHVVSAPGQGTTMVLELQAASPEPLRRDDPLVEPSRRRGRAGGVGGGAATPRREKERIELERAA